MTVRILHGDCRHVLASLPAESVHCVVTSPPYFGLRSYGIGTEKGEIGLEATPDEYVAELVAVFREVRRVLRKDGTVWLNLGDSYAGSGKGGNPEGSKWSGFVGNKDREASAQPNNGKALTYGLKPKDLIGIPWRVAFALQADGWWLRSDIIWAKPNPMPESVTDRPTSAHEHVFLLAKSSTYYFDAEAVKESDSGRPSGNGFKRDHRLTYAGRGDNEQWEPGGGRNIRNVWTVATQPYSESHFATFPPALIEPCIKAGTSEKGCCPHCGGPWERQAEVQRTKDPTRHSGRASVGCVDRQDADMPRMLATIQTLGWQPSCSCPSHDPLPATVLDPFGGAGTSGLVADRLGRDAILIELNPAYAAMTENRLRDDAGMFASVALEAAE